MVVESFILFSLHIDVKSHLKKHGWLIRFIQNLKAHVYKTSWSNRYGLMINNQLLLVPSFASISVSLSDRFILLTCHQVSAYGSLFYDYYDFVCKSVVHKKCIAALHRASSDVVSQAHTTDHSPGNSGFVIFCKTYLAYSRKLRGVIGFW